MAIRITCINKDQDNHQNPHEGITDFGWINKQTRATSKSTPAQMIEFLERQNGKAYVEDRLGNVANIGVVATSWGTKYLRTYSDGKWTDNLLSLPKCL